MTETTEKKVKALSEYLDINIDIEDIEKSQEMYKDANPIITTMLDDVDDENEFVNDIICADERIPYLNDYTNFQPSQPGIRWQRIRNKELLSTSNIVQSIFFRR